MANSFEPKTSIPLKPKTPPVPEPVEADNQFLGGLTLPAPKPRRKQCSLYLSEDMMERVRKVARQRGVTIGAVIEACVKASIDQLENDK